MNKKIIFLFLIFILIICSCVSCKNKEEPKLNDVLDKKSVFTNISNNKNDFKEKNERKGNEEKENKNSKGSNVGYIIDNDKNKLKQEKSGFSEESLISLEQIYALIEAYKLLINSDFELNTCIQNDIEYLKADKIYDIKSKDNLKLTDNYTVWSVGINYYYSFIRKNIETCYNFVDYVKNTNRNEILYKHLKGNEKDSKEIMLLEAIRLVNYLSKCKSITSLNFKKDSTYIVSGIKSGYSMSLNCDNKSDLIAIFDSNKNLLNIIPIDDNWNSYLYTKF